MTTPVRRKIDPTVTLDPSVYTQLGLGLDCEEAMIGSSKSRSGIGHDKWNIIILLVLYTLQGLPMGLSGSIPLILKERGISYEGLSLFSLVSLPFSLKLLWAPFVDSCYLPHIGRRKSWLIPVQIVTGLVMITGSHFVSTWIGDKNGGHIDITPLTIFFLVLYFLMATQDIAVDGWALTLLSQENVGYASVCNAVGQSFGFFLANQGFIALSDPNWCRRFLGFENSASLVSLGGFMRLGGWVFIITTVVVAFFKAEKPADGEETPETLIDTYKQVAAIFKLRSIQLLCLVLFTCKVAFSPADAVAGFKLQENGMSKADIATISPLLLIIGLVLPAFTSNLVSKVPLNVFMVGVYLKLFTSACMWFVVGSAKQAYRDPNVEPGFSFFAPLIVTMMLHEVAGTLMFVSIMSFHSKVSDPSIGGTYMTLLNTLSNLGAKWPTSTALWLLPKLTLINPKWDPYTIETMICLALGVLWVVFFQPVTTKLQGMSRSEWMIAASKQDVVSRRQL